MWNSSGIGTYLRNLVPRVIAGRKGYHFHLMGDIEALQPLSGGRTSVGAISTPIYSVAEQRELRRGTPADTDLFWAPHYNFPLVPRGRLLVTLHDLLHLAQPHFVRGVHRRFYARAMFHVLRHRAVAVVCDSRFTADEYFRLTGATPKGVHVIHIGVDSSWFRVEDGASPEPRPYFVFVGNVKPHKNLLGLITAFGSLVSEIPHDLIIVGRREGFITGDAGTLREAKKLGDRVRFTGEVSDEEVRRYLHHADALLFPSFYEGFGLPPLEAMACGCPVIASSAASIPEVCGDAALYFNPADPAAIAAQIRRLRSSEALRDELRERGRDRARAFTWERCAAETATVLDSVLT